jgi:hypothetical protein
MKANKAGEQALITILNGLYEEIHAIERKFAIRMDEGDFRPRIEYFHDAIRALTSGQTGVKRLSIEFLSYDIAMLRHIQANPLRHTKGAKADLSPGTGLIAANAPHHDPAKTPLSVKSQLADMYKSYSVLFAALLSGQADNDYQARIAECNEEVENIAALERDAKKTAQKNDVEIDIEALIHQHVDDPDMARKVFAAAGAKKKKMQASEAARTLSEMIKNVDRQINAVEQAHFTFATNQLAVYEMARDVVKKMAVGGLNIAGDFVENAVREATRGGRGF